MVNNNNGCMGCKYLTPNGRCCYNDDDLELLDKGDCESYYNMGVDPNDL